MISDPAHMERELVLYAEACSMALIVIEQEAFNVR
jgi:hypothetical protein